MKGLVSKETVVSRQQGGETPKIGMKQDVGKAHITIVKISQGWCFKSSPFKRQRASTWNSNFVIFYSGNLTLIKLLDNKLWL